MKELVSFLSFEKQCKHRMSFYYLNYLTWKQQRLIYCL